MYLRTLHQIAALIVDQEQFSPVSLSGKIMTLSVCVFSLMFVFGILLNLIGADLVVSVAPSKIDSLSDLLNTNIQPYIIKNLFLYELLKASPEGSKLHHLWLKTGAVGKGIINIDFQNKEQILNDAVTLLDDVNNSTAAILLADYAINPASKSVVCMYFKQFENVTQADQLFAPGMISWLMSWKAHPYTEKAFSYIATTIYETQLLVGAVNLLPSQNTRISPLSVKYGRQAIQCGQRTNEHRTQTPTFSPLTPNDMTILFKFYFLATFASFFPFIYSLISYELAQQRKMKKKTQKVLKIRVKAHSTC